MASSQGSAKVGVFVDASNIYMNGGQKMRFDVLRLYAQQYGTVQRLNAYLSYDEERASDDPSYRDRSTQFHEAVRGFGFHTTLQMVRWYTDPDTGRRFGKANVDTIMAVDVVCQAEHLDYMILVTGDSDFVRAVEVVRNAGVRVEVIGFDHVSRELRKEADLFTSGYLIPELLPTNPRNLRWGDVGSTVRGVCYYHQQGESYGFLSFMDQISPESWITDPRMPDSPYRAVFFHDSALPPGVHPSDLPNRRLVFEFEIEQKDRGLTTSMLWLAGGKNDPTERVVRDARPDLLERPSARWRPQLPTDALQELDIPEEDEELKDE